MCPECEAPRGRYHKGPDENDDGQVIRQRECRNCGLRYPTVEVAVTGTTFYRLADEYRRVNTERMRDARNYRASQNGDGAGGSWSTSVGEGGVRIPFAPLPRTWQR
jgi:transcriptional regulator NrdR family protein